MQPANDYLVKLTVLAPIMKAKKSVKDVIVIETPCRTENHGKF